MTLPPGIEAALAATWPAARIWQDGPFTLRDGAGGGSRVSAATVTGDWDAGALDAAIARHRITRFRVAADDARLDAALAARGYAVQDRTLALAAPVAALCTPRVPPVTAWTIWEPLAIMDEIWATAGIGPARRAVMNRVAVPKTAILGRINDTAAGAAFVACAGPVAMLHALEVAEPHRSAGLGRWMVTAAAHWAQAKGAETLAVLVTEANGAARALYARLQFTPQGGYHYRTWPEDPR